MLSFGSPAPFVDRIKQSPTPLICQAQSIAHARQAVETGADVVIAQGGEAGGHSGNRSTFTLVPEVADFLTEASANTLFVAAGGVLLRP
jgi:nitronate monooxygenase